MKAGWDLVKLGSVCDIQNGFAFDSKLFNNERKGFPLIRIRDIKRGYSETFTTEKCDNAYVVKEGDYLIGMDGEFNIGQWKSENALLNQRVCKLLPSSKILPRFIYYFIPKALKDIEARTAYATVKHLSSKQIKEIYIPNLSLTEQQRIVDILDQEFAKIDALKANAEKSLQAAKDLFQATLKKELEPKEGWKTMTIGELSHKITDGSHNPPKGIAVSKYRMLSSQNVWNGYLDKSVARYLTEKDFLVEDKRTRAREGDVLLTIVGTIGRTCVLSKEDDNITFQRSVCIIKPKPELNPFFLCYQLQSKNEEINQQANGAAQKGFYLKQVQRLPIQLTSVEEQVDIVSRLDILNNKCKTLQENYQKTLALCDDLKQALLRKAFKGEL